MIQVGLTVKKPCAFEGQSLLDHMMGVEKIVREKFVSDGYGKVVSKRSGGMFSETEGDRLIVLSAVMHDIGKADERYQVNFDNQCNAVNGKFSFKDHEVISSAYLLKVGVDPHVAMAVLLHHHAMRVPDEKIIRSIGEAKLYMTRELCEYLKSQGVDCIDKLSKEDVMKVIYLPKYVKNMHLVSLLELPLVIADNLDSQRRGDEEDRRTFIREVKRLYG